MSEPLDLKMLDKRVNHRYVKKGLLNEKDLERHMKSLPDLAGQAVPVEATLEPMNVGPAAGNHPDED